MRILLVEDNKSFADNVIATLRNISDNFSIFNAKGRDSSIAAIKERFFDLIILDLNIPTVDDELDGAVDHGQAVFYEAQANCPGTPIYILTGSEPDKFCLDLARHGSKIDLWGTGKEIPGVLYFPKDDANRLVHEVVSLAELLGGTDKITINTRGKNITLSPEQKRTLRIFTRANGGSSCEISRLGGLSDAIVLRVTVHDFRQNVRALCVAKLGLAEKISKEIQSFESDVKLLKMGAFAPVVKHLNQGLKGFAGVFYSLAEGYDSTLFDAVANDISSVPEIIDQVRSGLERWTAAKKVERVKISRIRQRVLSDSALDDILEKFNLPFVKEIEEIEVDASISCIHGDLHGANILVNPKYIPVLIDFGDVGEGYTCLDPVTLELSMVFHPDGSALGLAGPLLKLIERWPDIETYIESNQLKPAIVACRDWAHDVGGGDKAVLAAGYAFGIRQLKYATVDPSHTLLLLTNIAEKLLARDD